MAAAATHPPRHDRATHDGPGLRRIVPSKALPGSRAVVGGLLVAVAGVGTFAAATGAGGDPAATYVVARHDVAPGTVLDRADLAVVRGAVPPSARARVFGSVDDVVGAVVVGPLAEGELVQAGSLAATADAVPTFSIALDPADADAGALAGGDVVEVLATYGADAGATTVSLSSAARVVAATGDDQVLGSAGRVVVRLAVADAEERSAIVHASVTARLTLVRTTGTPPTDVVQRFRPALTPDQEDAGS